MPNFNNTTSFSTNTWNVYTADSKVSDASYNKDENEWSFKDFPKYYGIYQNIGQFRQAINAFATWCIGQGYECLDEFGKKNVRDEIILDNIRGWGEDTFLSILWQMIVIKKVNGNSFAEIIRSDKGTLINLKPLDPYRVKIVSNNKGKITGYKYTQGENKEKTLPTERVLHLCNDRTIDEPHGNSVTKAVEWVVEALEEAKALGRRMIRLSSITIIYVDENDTTRQNQLKTELKAGIDKGSIVLLPCKKEEASIEHTEMPPIQALITWLNYLEDQFYKQIGVPKVVLGGTAENTEASAKVGVISYEPTWVREITELEKDIWNQLAIRIKIRKQPSLMDNMQTDEAKNTGQTKLKYQGSQ